MTLAIDRFTLPDHLEQEAQRRAAELPRFPEPLWASVMLGFLAQAVAVSLEDHSDSSRDRLAVDLRVVQIVRGVPQ